MTANMYAAIGFAIAVLVAIGFVIRQVRKDKHTRRHLTDAERAAQSRAKIERLTAESNIGGGMSP